MKIGLLSINGAHCGSCVYAIEHVGRKLPGVTRVRVYVNRDEIEVEYDVTTLKIPVSGALFPRTMW